jgi:type II secretion system protein I
MYKFSSSKLIKSKGFTLFEVLIALLVFSILVSVVMYRGQMSIKNTDRIKRKVLAAQIADNYIINLHIRDKYSGAATYPQVQNYAGHEWVIKERFEETNRPNIRKVIIEVFEGSKLPDANTPNIYVLDTYLRKVK